MTFEDRFRIKSFSLLKMKGVNNRDLNAFAVKTILAWLKVGSNYIVNFEIIKPLVMDFDVLLAKRSTAQDVPHTRRWHRRGALPDERRHRLDTLLVRTPRRTIVHI